jgi:hypothetical protein
MKDQINSLFISFQMLDRLGVQGDIYSTVYTSKYFIKASQREKGQMVKEKQMMKRFCLPAFKFNYRQTSTF